VEFGGGRDDEGGLVLIGEVAAQAGVSVKTVRHYESLGLIRAERRSNGYRDYADDSPKLVSEAYLLNRLGIRLDRTVPFLQCLVAGNVNSDDCPDSVATYRRAIADLTQRIDELSARREALAVLLEDAVTRPLPQCEFAAVEGKR
jgi:DNA-binding transcriptional MerR regulator